MGSVSLLAAPLALGVSYLSLSYSHSRFVSGDRSYGLHLTRFSRLAISCLRSPQYFVSVRYGESDSLVYLKREGSKWANEMRHISIR
jgi:hypothetical protein